MKIAVQSDEMSSLSKLHQSLDIELRKLTRRGHMTPAEQLRVRVLKKEKLHAKDRLRVLAGRARVR